MLLDVFSGSAFDVVSLTASINRIPYKPSRIGAMGLFASRGITTTIAIVDEKDGVLSLLPTSARGAPAAVAARGGRRARSFTVPHIQLESAVMADEVQGVRAFGSEDAMEGVAQVVNDKIAEIRQSHEVTLEYHRLGAIKGLVLDADGTTVVHNLFTEFEVTQAAPVVGGFAEFDFTAASPAVKVTCLNIVRAIEASLGGRPYEHIHCFCDSTFFDGLTGEAGVIAAYDMWQQGAALRNDMRRRFDYGGITFEEYHGGIGTVAFIEAGAAYCFPVGVPGLFTTTFAPADYIETVNTVGKPYYAKQERMDFDKGIMINTQSNPLCLCTMPMTLVRARFV